MVSSTPWLHVTPGKDPVPVLQEAGWAARPVWTGGISRHHRDSIPDRPARSQKKRNEYQEYFLGGKGGRCLRLTLPPSCAVVTKSGNLNFLEPFGHLQACNGTALPLNLRVSRIRNILY